MSVPKLFTPNILRSRNFYNLALFICHLFIDGEFQSGHVVYDPKIFPDQLIAEIQSNCPRFIPWQLTDVTKTHATLCQPNQNTDHILQLVFLDPKHSSQEIDKELFVFHRIFITSTENENKIIDLQKSNTGQHNNLMVLHYNPMEGSIRIYRLLNKNPIMTETEVCSADEQSHILPDHKIKSKQTNIFDLTFGEYERTWLAKVSYTILNSQKETQYMLTNAFTANYLVSQFNALYINQSHVRIENGVSVIENRIIYPRYRKLYGDLTNDYDTLNNKTLYVLNQIKL